MPDLAPSPVLRDLRSVPTGDLYVCRMQVMNDEVPERESLKQTLKQTHLTKANLLKFLLSLAYGVSWLFAVSYPEIRGNRTL